ncbi:regulator of nonsense transcripts 2 [Tribolium madens]|uniref:regulator of nonsense transcripts 2 n=1 Tax=Tribolium madens TaxID=41895 RepID=UPI001CF72135|nr:regulator of nonsense transcripts 2 [Tribolium madens]
MTVTESSEHDGEKDENSAEAPNENDINILTSYIQEVEERFVSKRELRSANQNAANARPSESHFSKLDSSLKKNTAFVKKIKNFTANQVDTYLKDMTGLNLSKYISEIAAAIVDAKLKMTDVAAAVKMCSVLHQTYADFSQHLFENWQKTLAFKVGEKIPNPSKLRVDLRFYAELVQAGVFNNKNAFTLLGTVITTLVNMDKDEHYNCSIILSFCKHCGEDYAGLVPRKMRELSEKFDIPIPKSTFLPPEKQQNVRSLLRDYYISLSKHLVKDHQEIQNFEKQNMRILQTKGELSQERKDKLESLQTSYDKLLASTQSFAEILDEDMPTLKNQTIMKNDESMIVTGAGPDLDEAALANIENVWCDIETQRFYCELPELQAFLPTSYINKQTPPPEESVTEEVLDSEIPTEELEDDEKAEEASVPAEDEPEDSATTNASNKILLEAFFNNLPNCVNREMIDNAAIDFLVTLNSKHNRKKLVRALFGVNRTRLDLLPFYARFVAILRPALPEVGNELCQMLRQDFKYHVRKKDQINIESKIKVVRFIGELVKFKLYSKIEALYCLKVLLYDFSHHHIEMACNLLEVCGRFLYCSPDSHQRTRVYLEQMMRKKAVMALDSRYVTQIENAYYYVNPPEVTITKKERPIMHQFIRKLLFQDLQKNNTDKIMRLIRKLDWSSQDVSAYAIKCLSSAHNVKYFNIRCLANLLAGLVTYQEEVGTRVVDSVLEDIRLGMEVNLPKYNQRRVAQVKYLGELYNYRMVESADIFKVLYSLITFGVSMDPNVPSPLDPPNHLFRIRLACVLLETCGTYFSSGSSKRRLDYYLIFLQSYYWFKRDLWKDAFPPTLEHIFKDTLTTLRPKIKLCQSYEETQTELNNIRVTLGFDKITGDSNENKVEEDGLETIAETDTEEQGEDEVSEVTAPITDDTATEDETVDHTQGSDDEGEPDGSEAEQEQVSESLAIPSGPRKVECPEDEEFLNALDKMVSENIQERMREPVKAGNVDISVPVVLKSNKKTYEQLQDAPETECNKIGFVLMVRKGNKQQYKNFEADINSELAQNLRDQELAQKEEKERVKRLTLNITERFEEEDYQDMMQQQNRPVTQNLNRERKKYQHPKGAPDADLIFGPKRVR